MPLPNNHWAMLPLRLPVTDPRGYCQPKNARTLIAGSTDPVSPPGYTATTLTLNRESRRRKAQPADPVGDAESRHPAHCRSTLSRTSSSAKPAHRSPAECLRRRGRNGSAAEAKANRSPSRRKVTSPTPHAGRSRRLRWGAPGLEPSVTGADRGVAGERQLLGRGEDAYVVRIGVGGRTHERGFDSSSIERTVPSRRRRGRRRRGQPPRDCQGRACR